MYPWRPLRSGNTAVIFRGVGELSLNGSSQFPTSRLYGRVSFQTLFRNSLTTAATRQNRSLRREHHYDEGGDEVNISRIARIIRL